MATVHTKGNDIYIRCWDGTEMEFEFFTQDEIIELTEVRSNLEVAQEIGAVLDRRLNEYLNTLR